MPAGGDSGRQNYSSNASVFYFVLDRCWGRGASFGNSISLFFIALPFGATPMLCTLPALHPGVAPQKSPGMVRYPGARCDSRNITVLSRVSLIYPYQKKNRHPLGMPAHKQTESRICYSYFSVSILYGGEMIMMDPSELA